MDREKKNRKFPATTLKPKYDEDVISTGGRNLRDLSHLLEQSDACDLASLSFVEHKIQIRNRAT